LAFTAVHVGAFHGAGFPRNRLRSDMKLIIAIIRPEKLADVKRALFQVGVTGMTLSRVSGHGGERNVVQQYRGESVVMEFHEKVRIEMACSEPFVERTIQAICDAARTGDVGDGKIFVMPLDHTVRIRTGERDNNALTAINADEVMRITQLEMPVPRMEDR
jgi:nitrogen regulatory protein P-II 1